MFINIQEACLNLCLEATLIVNFLLGIRQVGPLWLLLRSNPSYEHLMQFNWLRYPDNLIQNQNIKHYLFYPGSFFMIDISTSSKDFILKACPAWLHCGQSDCNQAKSLL